MAFDMAQMGFRIQHRPKSYIVVLDKSFQTKSLSPFCLQYVYCETPLQGARLGGSVGCTVRLETGGRWFNSRRGRQHSFMEIDHEIFSTVILSLLLIQEGQFSVSGERMCTILVSRFED